MKDQIMSSLFDEKMMDACVIPSSSSILSQPSARKSSMRAIIVFDGEETLNRSSCSSLTNDSDLISGNGVMEDALQVILEENQEGFAPPTSEKRKKRKHKANTKSVSYAQLFFDPSTKTLVALMEVTLPVRFSMWHQRGWHVETENETFSGRKAEEGEGNENALVTAEESRFPDGTLLTECSSISSDMCREGPELCTFHEPKHRFSDEPVVFSHRGISSQVWIEESELNLYLLHDSADPFNASIRKSVGCTDTLKKLLTLRACISLGALRQVNESKWKATTGSVKGVGGHKLLENMSYSVLQDF